MFVFQQLELLKSSKHSEADGKNSSQEKLNNAEISRYSRQLILPEIGVKGLI